MKYLVCAINTKYIHSNPAVYILTSYALAHCAELSGKDIETAEYTINNRPDEVMGSIYEKRPDVLFFSCYIWNFEYILELAENLHKVLPQTDIWLGGPEVSFEAESVLERNGFLKGIMMGEGERSFLELIRYYQRPEEHRLSEIPGICWRGKENPAAENALHSGTACRPVPLEDVPFIYQDGNIEDFQNKILYYESSRGCPFSCSYCLSSVGPAAERKVRLRSLELVLRELQFFLDHKVRQVKFVDRTFNIDSRRCAAILEFLLQHDNGVTNFHFEMAGELLTEQELQILEQMRPGLVQLEIGVQSVNPETLRRIHRKADLERLKEITARILRAGNIHLHLDLIAGLPEEDYGSFARSFCEVYAMQPSQLQLGFLKVLKGTEMKTRAREYGIRYTSKAPYEVLETRWITYGEILRLKQVEEMLELYYNSRQFTQTLLVLETEFTNPFEMFEQLAAFYQDRGYFVQSPSRIRRYQVLLEFVREIAPDQEPLYRELLTFDLYARENLKSRPPFAADQSPYKQTLRELLKSRAEKEQLHAEVFFYPVGRKTAEKILDPSGAGPRILIFNYSKRDPLDHNAGVEVFEMS